MSVILILNAYKLADKTKTVEDECKFYHDVFTIALLEKSKADQIIKYMESFYNPTSTFCELKVLKFASKLNISYELVTDDLETMINSLYLKSKNYFDCFDLYEIIETELRIRSIEEDIKIILKIQNSNIDSYQLYLQRAKNNITKEKDYYDDDCYINEMQYFDLDYIELCIQNFYYISYLHHLKIQKDMLNIIQTYVGTGIHISFVNLNHETMKIYFMPIFEECEFITSDLLCLIFDVETCIEIQKHIDAWNSGGIFIDSIYYEYYDYIDKWFNCFDNGDKPGPKINEELYFKDEELE